MCLQINAIVISGSVGVDGVAGDVVVSGVGEEEDSVIAASSSGECVDGVVGDGGLVYVGAETYS